MPLLSLDAGDFDGVIGHVELAGDFDFFPDVLLCVAGVIEHVAHGLAFWSMAHDERVVPVFERDDDAGEAVRHGLCVRGGVLLLLVLGVECRRTQTEGYGECEGCDSREQCVFLERQNIFPFPFCPCMQAGVDSLHWIGQRVGRVTGAEARMQA